MTESASGTLEILEAAEKPDKLDKLFIMAQLEGLECEIIFTREEACRQTSKCRLVASRMADEEEEESCLTRQFNEAAALKSIYCGQLLLLSDIDQPLECVIYLWGKVSSSDNISNVPRFDLHVKCSEEYPLVAPFIQLENCKKIANDRITALKEELLSLADSLKGEVHIHDLANHCENFLFNYDTPKSCSLYEGMMQRNKDLEEMKAKEQQKILEDEERKREEIMSHIKSQQQVMRKALRRKSKSETAESPDEVVPRERINSVMEHEPSSPVQTTIEGDPWDLFKTPGLSRFSSDFECIQKLGEGAYGEVLKARHRMDGGYYAIKKIELNPSDYSNFKIGKITREVKLLSCLNHENVVRYYNSWVEKAAVDKPDEVDSGEESDSNDTGFKSLKNDVNDMLPRTQMSLDFDESEDDDDDEDSDEFVRFSKGSGEDSSDERADISSSSSDESNRTLKPVLYMYIQMELCEKNTLRDAIDDGLYQDLDRVWRLFREIVEGLCHIHHQGIMHRDLKPVNIFLGNNDQVKIGDFGLATTSKAQKPTTCVNRDSVDTPLSERSSDSSLKDLSLSHLVGTPLYVAPEVDRNKNNYDKKVDVYSLGIIFFEMNHPPFKTTMEKYNSITSLRKPEVIIPPDFPHVEKSEEYKMIRWMLSHDIKERPSSEEILAHDRLVTVKLDEGDVKDMVNRTLCNPQSKDYKFLIASCFNQDMPAAFVATYNMSTFRSFKYISALNVVDERLRSIFHKYGAVGFLPPLFTPGLGPRNGVSLMTVTGGLIHTPYDLLMPFARYVVQNPSVMNFKRYAMGKVYREMPVGIHPKEVYECRFDIVSSSFGDLVPDLELLAIVRDILNAFPQLLRRNCVIFLNHSYLIATLIESCLSNSSMALNKTDMRDMRDALIKIMTTEYNSKVDLMNNLKSINLPERAINVINAWIDVEGAGKDIVSSLSTLVKDREALEKCHNAVKQLQRLMSECEGLKMPCPVLIKPSLVFNPSHYNGVLFQVKCDHKVKFKNAGSCTIAFGGRYDALLEELKQTIPSKEASKPSRCSTGFTLTSEALALTIDDDDRPATVDVLFCTLKCSPMTPERVALLIELWNLDLRVYCSNTLQTMDEITALCNHLGVQTLLLMKEQNCVRVRHLGSKSPEKKLTFSEVIDYLTKPSFNRQESISLSRQSSNVPKINFMEKVNIGNMKIYEDKIFENLASIMQRFSANVHVEVLALPVKGEFVKFVTGIIEFDDVLKSLEPALKRYSTLKKLILKTSKQIEDTKNTHQNAVIILYSLNDNIYKVLM